jgi:hypothetical protein
MKWIMFIVLAIFAVGLFFTQSFLSVMTLFTICFSTGTVFAIVSAYIFWQQEEARSWPVIAAPVGAGMFTILWIGANFADHEARFSRTTYKVVAKDGEFSEARLVRTSSSGFIIAHDKRFVFIPSGEIKSIAQTKPAFD